MAEGELIDVYLFFFFIERKSQPPFCPSYHRQKYDIADNHKQPACSVWHHSGSLSPLNAQSAAGQVCQVGEAATFMLARVGDPGQKATGAILVMENAYVRDIRCFRWSMILNTTHFQVTVVEDYNPPVFYRTAKRLLVMLCCHSP